MTVQDDPTPKGAQYRRAVRLLVALSANPEGLMLGECMAELGEAGRNASGANVTKLKALRDRNHVNYLPPQGRPRGSGRPCGTYVIAPDGMAWLAKKLAGLKDADVLEAESTSQVSTGAMEGDRPSILLSKACTGQAPLRCVASVFHLGLSQPQQPSPESRDERPPRSAAMSQDP